MCNIRPHDTLTTSHNKPANEGLPAIKLKMTNTEFHLHHAGTFHLLEQEFSALPLRCKAGDGPHFDLNASVELLVPHVPYSLDWCGYCFVLQIVKTFSMRVHVLFFSLFLVMPILVLQGH